MAPSTVHLGCENNTGSRTRGQPVLSEGKATGSQQGGVESGRFDGKYASDPVVCGEEPGRADSKVTGQESKYGPVTSPPPSCAIPARVSWAAHRKRMQASYDRKNPHRKAVKRLWRAAKTVRKDLEEKGLPQTALEQDKEALQVKGVIYAVFCWSARKVYVGQTINSVLQRFEQHTRDARAGQAEPFHKDLARLGLAKFSVFPLEVVDESYKVIPKAGGRQLKKFRELANPREMFWIRRLHSQVHNGGYNLQFAHCKRRVRRHRGNNPMKWARARKAGAQQGEEKKDEFSVRGYPLEAKYAMFESKEDAEAKLQLEDADEVRMEAVLPLVEIKEGPEPLDTLVAPGPDLDDLRWRRTQRRCVAFLALSGLPESKLVDHLKAYRQRNLRKMLYFLRSANDQAAERQLRALSRDVLDSNPNGHQKVCRVLYGFLLSRPQYPKKAKKVPDCVLVVRWVGAAIGQVGLQGLLRSPGIARLFPVQDCDVLVSFALGSPAGRLLFNSSKASRTLGPAIDRADCPCRRKFDEKFRSRGGCVETGDISIAPPELREIFKFGPRFRDQMFDDPVTELEKALTGFIQANFLKLNVPSAAQFAEWKACILQEAKIRLRRKPEPLAPWFSAKAKQQLRDLHRDLVIGPVDKAANNPCFMCKYLFEDSIRAELRSPSYEAVPRLPAAIVEDHKNFLAPWAIGTTEKLPYLYPLTKMHKDGKRFIAASRGCSTAGLSQILSKVLGKVMATLKDKDDASLGISGVRRFFVVKGFEEVARFLSGWKRRRNLSKHSLRSFDFTTMYTSIPHSQLLVAVSEAVQEAWQYMQSGSEQKTIWKIKWTPFSGASWVSGTSDVLDIKQSEQCHMFSAANINALVRFLVANTFIANSEGVSRQVIGIPMGTNCAPELANLFLYFYESRYIDSLVSRGHTRKAKAFHLSFRLIDDLLTVDNPFAHKFQEEVYPPELQLKETSGEGKVEFLGMTVETDRAKPRRLQISVFDKRDSFPFAVNKYPHFASNIPKAQAIGVITGQLHRFYRICTSVNDFLNEAVKLGNYVVTEKGYSAHRVVQAFRGFVVSNNRKYPRKAPDLAKAFVQRLLR